MTKQAETDTKNTVFTEIFFFFIYFVTVKIRWDTIAIFRTMKLNSYMLDNLWSRYLNSSKSKDIGKSTFQNWSYKPRADTSGYFSGLGLTTGQVGVDIINKMCGLISVWLLVIVKSQMRKEREKERERERDHAVPIKELDQQRVGVASGLPVERFAGALQAIPRNHISVRGHKGARWSSRSD